MPKALTRLLLAIPCVLALMVGPGCEDKVTAESYDQIKTGMDMVEVEDILGGSGELQAAAGVGIGADGLPQMQRKDDGDTKTYLWGDENKGIIVDFKEGKVSHKRKIGL